MIKTPEKLTVLIVQGITKNRMGNYIWISPYTELHAPLRMSSRWAPGLVYTLYS